MLEDAALESLQPLHVEAGFIERIGRQRLEALQGFDGERPGNAQFFPVDRSLIE